MTSSHEHAQATALLAEIEQRIDACLARLDRELDTLADQGRAQPVRTETRRPILAPTASAA